MERIRVLIAEDAHLVRSGFVSLLCADERYEVVAGVGDGKEAVDVALRTCPDLLMLDYRMPQKNGVAVADEVMTRYPETRVIIVSQYNIRQYMLEAFEQGVLGYVLKDSRPEDLFEAIDIVMQGRMYLDKRIRTWMEERSIDRLPDNLSKLEELTAREVEVLQYIAEAYSRPEIAKKLGIEVKTVDKHYENLKRKLGVDNKVALVRIAIDAGLLGGAGV